MAIIAFTLFQASNNKAIAASGEPDFSVSSSITEIILFIPGVTASLVAFLVFGTTKSWRQYRDLVAGGCGLRQRLLYKKRQRDEEASRSQGLEFERLPSLNKTASEEQRKVVKESEDRVRMFTQQLACDTDFVAESSRSQPPTHQRAPSNTRIPQFHLPMPVLPRVMSSDTAVMTSGTIEVGKSIDPEAQVAQFESRDKKTAQTHVAEKRFVTETFKMPKTQSFSI